MVDGKDITLSGVNLNDLRQQVGMVFQSFNLYPHMTALGNVTLSAGIAVRQARESWEQALARADAALYRAKQAGRNRVAYDEDGFLDRSAEDA
jgi:polar amino acid transport system ATP-binding protein